MPVPPLRLGWSTAGGGGYIGRGKGCISVRPLRCCAGSFGPNGHRCGPCSGQAIDVTQGVREDLEVFRDCAEARLNTEHLIRICRGGAAKGRDEGAPNVKMPQFFQTFDGTALSTGTRNWGLQKGGGDNLIELHWEVVLGIVEADIFDYFSEQGRIGRQEPCFDVAAEDIAEYPAKILVPWEGEEAS